MKDTETKSHITKLPHRGLGGFRIGCGAGFSGDRLEPAVILAEKGQLDYLVLECLAERTIALAQKRKLQDPTKGYDPLLERRIELLLPILIKNNVRLITNMGAANPIEGAKKIIEIAQKMGLNVKVAAVSGDDVIDELRFTNDDFIKFGNETFAYDLIVNRKRNAAHSKIVNSANAYLGIEGILEALKTDAQIIITGRVADPSLFLAPMIHEFGWETDNYDLMGKGTVIGHLLECAGHITGGYFADPIKKPVESMENLGHPFADIFPDGSAIISKVEGTGGIINLQTAKEQLLYEVVNPYEYFTPDVIADFTSVKLEEIGTNQIKVTGGTGKEKPKSYKVSVGYKAFWQGEGEISYTGAGAIERAQLAAEIIQNRIAPQPPMGEFLIEIRQFFDTHLGNGETIHSGRQSQMVNGLGATLRVAVKAKTQADAALIGEEIEALYTNGPAGGGGVRKFVNEVIGIVSVLVDRNKVLPKIDIFHS